MGLHDIPFVSDEPQLLDGARTQLQTGTWRVRSDLSGTSALFYGPSAYWFYGLVQFVAGPSPVVAAAAMAAAVSAAQAYFCLALARAATETDHGRGAVRTQHGRVVFGSLLLLTASSPHQYYWSRLAWDQLTNACAFLIVGLLLARCHHTTRGRLGIGLIIGFALSSHPMFVPLAVITAAVALVDPIPDGWSKLAGRALAVTVPAATVMAPWLMALTAGDASNPAAAAATGSAPARVLESFRGPGVSGIDVYFDGEWDHFLAHLPMRDWVAAVIEPSIVGWSVLGLSGLFLGIARRNGPMLLVSRAGLLAIVSYPLFYAAVVPSLQPHYQFPTGWIALVGVAALLSAASARVRGVALATVFVVAAVQLAFIGSWGAWIDDHAGTRGLRHGTTLAEQQRVVHEICNDDDATAVVLRIAAFPESFAYLASIDPACSDRSLAWCTSTDQCTGLAPMEEVLHVIYRSHVGGALYVVSDMGSRQEQSSAGRNGRSVTRG